MQLHHQLQRGTFNPHRPQGEKCFRRQGHEEELNLKRKDTRPQNTHENKGAAPFCGFCHRRRRE
jgi:hypothetical protein